MEEQLSQHNSYLCWPRKWMSIGGPLIRAQPSWPFDGLWIWALPFLFILGLLRPAAEATEIAAEKAAGDSD